MSVIYQTKNGITLVDGFYLAKNPDSDLINVISIYKEKVFVHTVSIEMSMEELVHFDSTGFMEVFEELKKKKDLIKNKTEET